MEYLKFKKWVARLERINWYIKSDLGKCTPLTGTNKFTLRHGGHTTLTLLSHSERLIPRRFFADVLLLVCPQMVLKGF